MTPFILRPSGSFPLSKCGVMIHDCKSSTIWPYNDTTKTAYTVIRRENVLYNKEGCSECPSCGGIFPALKNLRVSLALMELKR